MWLGKSELKPLQNLPI